MKKILAIAGGILGIIIIGIIMISVRETDVEVTKERTKVGFILNGTIDDHSWGQSHYEGMELCADSLNLEVYYRENVPADESCKEYIQELIDEGCEIIICNSFGFGEYALEMAKEHREIYFFHATGVEESVNLATYFGRIYQMRYLSGIVAGLQTKTDEIGYVAAYPIPEVNRGINAFTLGVRAVNPDAFVYVEWTQSWTGDAEAEAATEKLLDSHNIDVVTIHTDTNRTLEIAEERGVWCIGYNMDNYELYPNTFLTAPIFEWENFYEPHILECLQGKFAGKHYWDGAETGIVSLAPLSRNVEPGIQKEVEAANQKFLSGTFDVFYGPITDADGNVRVREMECMTDAEMLNAFNWYVEGVVTNVE
ncbi:MAG: BMP family ABC transporter substrate-binding protein [Lachnospiraceae bacterium]|nr:BMP family ABC transporter substrate-binding protein [Lachnospiraceae bacterium]